MTNHRLFLLLLLTLILLTVTIPVFSQDIQKLDPALDRLISPDAKLERVANGFNKWTEGPVWTRNGTLLFAEIPANNIVQWIPGRAPVSSCTPAATKDRTIKDPSPAPME